MLLDDWRATREVNKHWLMIRFQESNSAPGSTARVVWQRVPACIHILHVDKSLLVPTVGTCCHML
ncbi:hypothetical protein Mapa_000336 [Marchantia paleacea]|nr:hypothetical protein Mapa_000336 [Marchantia paleacea]